MIDDKILTPPPEPKQSAFRLAQVDTVTLDGVIVKFEGEETASDKVYKIMQSYLPLENDRVVLANISGTYIVMGSVGAPALPTEYIPESEKGQPNGVATLNSSGQLEQDALHALAADTATSATSSNTAASATNFSGRHTGSTLGFFGMSGSGRQQVGKLSPTATQGQVIDKVNEIINDLAIYNLITY